MVHQETINIENSDDRLAAVELAKRTGDPFISKASKQSQVVPTEVAARDLEAFSNDNFYVGANGSTYASWLEDYHESAKDPEFIWESNEEKAAAHTEMSKQLTLARRAEEAAVKAKQAQGFEPSFAVQVANQQRADADNAAQRTYRNAAVALPRNDVYSVIEQSEQILSVTDLAGASLTTRANALDNAAPNIPVVDESYAVAALERKDQIIATEYAYGTDFSLDLDKDHPGRPVLTAATDPEDLAEAAWDTLASHNGAEAT